jgi:Uma2 family endonuclease
MMNVPYSNHGRACGRIARLVGNYAEDQRLGQVFTNGSGIITEHNPDTVRGADIAYYSFHRVPAGQLPRGYLPIAPELVFEVLSPTDRRGDVLAKVAEY